MSVLNLLYLSKTVATPELYPAPPATSLPSSSLPLLSSCANTFRSRLASAAGTFVYSGQYCGRYQVNENIVQI